MGRAKTIATVLLAALLALAGCVGAGDRGPSAGTDRPADGASGPAGPASQTEKEAVSPEEAERLLAAFPTLEPPAGKRAERPVELVLFADFKCPHCKDFETTVFPKLKAQWIESGQARLVYVPLPVLGGDAVSAARAALFVFDQKPDAFWAYAEKLYAAQRPVQEAWATPARLAELAEAADPALDQEAVMEAAQRDDPRIEDAFRLARAWGVEGVPALLVAGKAVDPFDLNAIRTAVEASRSR
ncbi:MAG: thioredoxin domain-containing protein [Hydrogenibacillus schlegelii]|nr:thioredoxin domain-containing protein [Hydrogenibacillus schlegelii]